ncbi:hypothetical protein Mapa_012615 [Marchantia paleacea]|nr:hypothetical protein Mapa_012615 [Marchantia paleacea]
MATMESPSKTSQGSTLHRVITRAQEHAPSSAQVKTVVTWLLAGLVILAVGGTALMGISITLALVVPLLIFFSPVLIPLGIVLFLATAGTVSAVGSGILAISGISWLYSYCKGRDPPGANRVDAARERLVCTAREFKEWASNYSSQMRAAPSA